MRSSTAASRATTAGIRGCPGLDVALRSKDGMTNAQAVEAMIRARPP
jgi:hypothetical protein